MQMLALSALWTRIREHPVMTLQIAAGVAVAALLALLWIDYHGTKADLDRAQATVERLEENLVAEREVREAVAGRLDEFVEAQKLQKSRLEAMAKSQAETRQRISTLMREVSSLEIERLIEERPDEAPAIIVSRVNDVFGMFDDATATP